MKNRHRKLFSVWDIAIIIIVILASVFALLSQLNREDDSHLACVVRVDGHVVHTVSLNEVTGTEYYHTDTDVKLTVAVTSAGVSVKSTCPDKLCEHTGTITKGGQSIVCLPAHATVTLESSKLKKVDAVVR